MLLSVFERRAPQSRRKRFPRSTTSDAQGECATPAFPPNIWLTSRQFLRPASLRCFPPGWFLATGEERPTMTMDTRAAEEQKQGGGVATSQPSTIIQVKEIFVTQRWRKGRRRFAGVPLSAPRVRYFLVLSISPPVTPSQYQATISHKPSPIIGGAASEGAPSQVAPELYQLPHLEHRHVVGV